MGQVRVGQVDMSTGEIMEGAQLALVYPKRKNGFVDGWVAMAQDAMLQLAKLNLGNEASRVLFLVIAKLDFENWINLNQAALAAELGMQRTNFSRALRKLIDVGVVLAGPKVGRNGTYRLNPSFGWKGSARGHVDALRDRMKARGMSVIEGGQVEHHERDPNTPDMFQEPGDNP